LEQARNSLQAAQLDDLRWNTLGGSGVSRAKEPLMPYALFEKEFRLSRTFPTATDVWRCAEDCGLVIDEANGSQRLDDGYAIKPCPPDGTEVMEPASGW
jgi:hypothetical protein